MPTPEEDEVAASYALELAELTFNSKPIINSLTMIADEERAFSHAIAGVVLRKIGSALADKKLPIIYLLDSICKNVGAAYKNHFAPALPQTIGDAFDANGPKVRTSLQKLVDTWTGVFEPAVVAATRARIGASAAPAATAAPAPPGAAAPPRPAPPPAAGRKRVRGGAGVARESLKIELSALMGRIQAHESARLPPDVQLLTFVAQAAGINESILAQTERGSAEFGAVSAQLATMCERHAGLAAALAAEGTPIPPSAALPEARRQPQPPPQQHFAPPPPQQPMAQRPPPPPPSGAPSRAAAAAPPPPPVVDVSKLLNDLAAAGVINAAAPAAAPSLTQPQPQLAMPAPFAPPLSSSTLGSGPHSTLGALGAGGALGLGGGLSLGGLQGSSLGMNDPAISAAVHLLYRDREHAGWRGPADGQPAAGSPPLCRRWYAAVDEWVAAAPARQAGLQHASAFATLAHDNAAAHEPAPAAPQPLLRAPSNAVRVECSKCGEEISMVFDDESEEWMLQGAVDAGGGVFHHFDCAAPRGGGG